MRALVSLQRRLRAAALGIACFLLFTIMVIGSADALASNVLNQPIPGIIELSGSMLAVAFFLTLASVGSLHVRVDILVDRLSERKRRVCHQISLLVALFVFAIFAWRLWGLAIDSIIMLERAVGFLRYPVWPAKLVAAIGMTLATTQCLLDLSLSFKKPVRIAGDI